MGIAALLVALLPSRTIPFETPSALYTQPLVLRALSGYGHTLAADFFWLGSSRSGEMVSGERDAANLWRYAQSVAVLDSGFSPAVNYYATYFASVRGEVDRSARLYELARQGGAPGFETYLYDIMLRLTYGKGDEEERIVRLVKEAYAQEGKTADEAETARVLSGFLVYARNKAGREARAKEDLAWLLERTESPVRRAALQAALARLKP